MHLTAALETDVFLLYVSTKVQGFWAPGGASLYKTLFCYPWDLSLTTFLIYAIDMHGRLESVRNKIFITEHTVNTDITMVARARLSDLWDKKRFAYGEINQYVDEVYLLNQLVFPSANSGYL